MKLKELLGFDDRYDEKMTKCHYVLQTVRKHPKGKNPGDMWSIKTDKFPDAHFAIFPRELVRRCIQSTCPPNGIVLDPFAGSRTVGEVARELGKKSILIEINPSYPEIMRKRCGLTKQELKSHLVFVG